MRAKLCQMMFGQRVFSHQFRKKACFEQGDDEIQTGTGGGGRVLKVDL